VRALLCAFTTAALIAVGCATGASAQTARWPAPKANAWYAQQPWLRIVMLPVLLGLYLYSRDPLFISLLVVVGLGVVLTGVSYWLDRRENA